ncbi:MAG: ABC transporter substrate-binding protein [Calditerrivibrio sp.]|uniref:ABC transporter substrate-binding protein n=1 Tax=Calditerrivibrio sp. TaxID=2792612 RepID=UPI003D0D85C1
MERVNINENMTILELVSNYPESIEVLISNGFPQFEDKTYLESVGKFLKFSTALKTKGYDIETYIKLIEEKISSDKNYKMATKIEENFDINIVGLLPCPVRVPLQEQFTTFIEKFEKDKKIKVNYKFEAASIGIDYLKENILSINDPDKLPDIFISAGFEAFFDQKSLGLFKEKKVFVDITDDEVNENFRALNIKDPHGDYSIISLVVAVFMVNKKELGDLPVPKSWSDLLKPEYAQRVALPVGDFDLFNGILLNIYKDFGYEGIEKIAKTLLKSMHPSQMVKNANMKNAEKPAITIMPYFFTKMVRDVSSMEVIWPEDGAIVAPVFMLVKRSKREILEPIARFIAGKEMGEILSHRGLFPSLNKDVKNIVPENAKFKWLGWDFIYSYDVGGLIHKLNELFEKSASEVQQ